MEDRRKVFIGRYSIVADDVTIGNGVKIWDFCKLCGCEIGDYTEIGSYCEIKNNARLGKNCIIKSYVSIASGTQIKDFVFVSPKVIFLNDRFPSVRGFLENNWNLEAVIIEEEAVIGGGSIILLGIKIRRGAFIGAGSVVTKNVPEREIWVGNPARFYRKI